MVKITDATLKGLKGDGKQREIKDDISPLRIMVQPTGARSFTYRWKKDGKSHRHTFGYYPTMSLADARDAAIKFKIDLKHRKIEPVVAPVVPVEPVKDTRMTVSEAYALYVASDGVTKLSEGTQKEKERAFEKEIEPAIGTLPLVEITYEQIEDIIDNKYERILADGGNGVGANRLHANFSGFFRYCRTGGRKKTGLRTNPMLDMPKPASENSLDRYFNDRELGWFFAALPAAKGHERAYELLLRTVCRRSEILDLRWSMFEKDRLVFGTSKNGRPHVVSLTPSAVALIGVRPDKANDNDRIFDNHPTANTRSMARLVAKMAALASANGSNKEVEHWTLHTFRRTATSLMAGFHDANDNQLISADTRSKVLNHVDATMRGRVYDKYDDFAEKKAALFLWGDHLDKIKAKALAV